MTNADTPLTTLDAVEITRRLIRFDTINPPGNERPALEWLAGLLAPAGFEIVWQEMGEGRANLLATLSATRAPARAPLVLSGHVDTVPLGNAPWTVPTHEGLERDGRLYGRGASDMKSGVAACVRAALDLAAEPDRAADLRLILSAGEETGCEGVLALAGDKALLGTAGALIVAEPTDNRPLLGHKGALWLHLNHRGVTAHGSMPEKGRNAIFGACASVAALRDLDFDAPAHPVMGPVTLNLGTLRAGLNINSVPDLATLGVDIRTTPELSNARARDLVTAAVGAEVEIETLTDMAAVFTPANDPWMAETRTLAASITGVSAGDETAHYFTDASVLTAAFGHPPTLIMGPGPMALAHQTDEYCETALITACARAFAEIGRRYLS
ncbi:M20 family metallopeptidase [Alkalilacustris brevis]|uniref:M20 family metallopeptidase n=1 Tax=Alkalilacustris brevis TaxID=2026338 RepID=UPI000E0D4653|nr:M20 family metallopeptidase [Alkalilacustris brevis]